MKYLVITCDQNDADYLTICHELDNLMILDVIKPFIEVIAKRDRHHNWHTGEHVRSYAENPSNMYNGELTDDQIDYMNGVLPYGEYGIHTINSIRIMELVETLL